MRLPAATSATLATPASTHRSTAWQRQATAAVLTAWLAASGIPAQAADAAEQRYQRERADCLAGRSVQDRNTCLKEAGAARSEARRPASGSATADLARNQRQRCEALPATDRQACVARMSGGGSTEGSVSEGGISREITTRTKGVPAAPAAPAPASPAASASVR